MAEAVDALRYGSALLVGDGQRRLASAPESQRSRPATFGANSHNQAMPLVSWSGRVIDFWSRYQLVTTFGFAAFACGTLSYLLWRSTTGRAGFSTATSALVVGLLGVGAFVLLSLTALVRNALLVQISRDLRRLYSQLD